MANFLAFIIKFLSYVFSFFFYCWISLVKKKRFVPKIIVRPNLSGLKLVYLPSIDNNTKNFLYALRGAKSLYPAVV
jgi:hypothetical protein